MFKNKLLMGLTLVTIIFTYACSSSSSSDKSEDLGEIKSSYRVEYLGPGGHSNGAYGAVNAVHAAGRTLVYLDKFENLPAYKIYNFYGGNSVNSIAADAFFTVDIYSDNEDDLVNFKRALINSVNMGVSDENSFRGRSAGQTNPTTGGRIDVRAEIK